MIVAGSKIKKVAAISGLYDNIKVGDMLTVEYPNYLPREGKPRRVFVQADNGTNFIVYAAYIAGEDDSIEVESPMFQPE